MDFQSAMETFAEAWVAANSGKLVAGSGVPCVSVGSSLDLNKAAESIIQQQLGKGVYSSQQQEPIENRGLDYPKIHPRSLTPLIAQLPVGATGGGMDLSPSSKRIKGFPPHQNNANTSVARRASGHHLPEFDHAGLFLPGPHSSAAAAAAVLVGKSLPIHCVIEVSDKDVEDVSNNVGSVSSTGGSNNGGRGGDKSVGKDETGGSGNGCGTGGSFSRVGIKTVEVDDFVIIPAGTMFQDVVATVLTLLGYPKDIVQQAEGSIMLKNWKPLKLDQVCDSPHKTVGDIFNDLTNHATLRVLVKRSKGGTAEDLKEKLLRLLLAQSSNILMGSGCPLDEATLCQLVKGPGPQNLAEDVRRRFDQWYSSHQHKLAGGLEHGGINQSHSSSSSHQLGGNNDTNGSPSNLSVTSSHHNHLVNGASLVRHPLIDKSYDDDSSSHPAFHGLTTQKTRMRTSFDPEMELPRLQQWFAENPHPSRHQIQQYLRELNSLDCRKDRKPLDMNNVVYWFKNARAAQKRNELRFNGYSPSHGFPHHLQTHNPNTGHELNPDDRVDQEDGQSYLNENSGSSCRDSGDDHDHEMKDGFQHQRDEMDEENDGESDPLRHSINPNKRADDAQDPDDEMKVVIKEEHEEDFISVDVELTEGGGNLNPDCQGENGESCNNNEPKDLSGKAHPGEGQELTGKKCDETEKDKKEIIRSSPISKTRQSQMEQQQPHHEGSNSNSPSITPRSSPGLSPTHPYDFSGAPSMVNRFHPFFDHPFMAYRHFNSFNFGQSFPGSNGPGGGDHEPTSSYEAAMGMMGRKGVFPQGKPSPGLESYHEFSNGVSIVQGTRGSGGSIINSGNGELFGPRSTSNAELISSFINSSRGELGLGPLNLGAQHHSPDSRPLDERRKRNRTFIDPVTEVPRLESWFAMNSHPSHSLILKYTETLNSMPYRQKFPKLEPKNVQFWWKNRRAKCKRLKMAV